MGIKIGQLRSIVKFKINIPEALGAGFTDDFFDFGQTRGFLQTRSGYRGGTRNMNSGDVEFNNSYELYIWYQPYYARVDLLIEIEGRRFTIDSVENMEEGRKTFLMYILTEKK